MRFGFFSILYFLAAAFMLVIDGVLISEMMHKWHIKTDLWILLIASVSMTLNFARLGFAHRRY